MADSKFEDNFVELYRYSFPWAMISAEEPKELIFIELDSNDPYKSSPNGAKDPDVYRDVTVLVGTAGPLSAIMYRGTNKKGERFYMDVVGDFCLWVKQLEKWKQP